MLSESEAVEVLKALADPNRLTLFKLLLCSDRTNSELMAQTGLRQNLLSHHLNILCESKLVQAQQSIGDARRHYYTVDLRAVRDFQAWWQTHTPPDTLPTLRRPRRVLFLCYHNASRSVIAEIVARHLLNDMIIPFSAGLQDPVEALPPVTLQVLAERGLSGAPFVTKRYDELPPQHYDYLVTVCDIVHENSLPDSIQYDQYVHWSLHDPVEGITDEAEQLRLARELYDEITLRLVCLVQRIAQAEESPTAS
jgi:arsenate reductase